MTGFPGETEEQFEELLDFVRRRRFERLGVFAFCSEPGTPAAELDGHLPEEVKQSSPRSADGRAAGNRLRLERLAGGATAGRDDRPLHFGRATDAYVGRSYADAPEVDGQVYVTGEDLAPGQIVPCEIVAAQGL